MPKLTKLSPVRTPSRLTHWIKIAILILLLLGAAAFQTYAAQVVGLNYLSAIFVKASIVSPLLLLFLAVFLFFIISGIAAVLLEPVWLACLAFFGTALVTLFFFGFQLVPLCVCATFALCAIGYVLSVRRLQKNQIHFTTHPLANAKRILSLAIVLLISASFSLGWMTDATQRQFTLPPEFKQFFVSTLTSQARSAALKPLGAHPTKMQTEAVEHELNANAEKSFADIETGLKPKTFILPILLGSIVFCLLFVILLPIMYLALGVTSFLLWILCLTKFARRIKEQREVITLAL
jgi:hypothetical protein